MKARVFIIGALWAASLGGAYLLRPESVAPGSSRPAAPSASTKGATAEQVARLPDQKKHEVAAVLTERRELFEKPESLRDFRSRAAAFGAVLQWTPAEIREAIDLVRESAWPPDQKHEWYDLLLPRWAETDGASAMAFCEQLPTPNTLAVLSQRGLVNSVAKTWAVYSPDEAWRWAQLQGWRYRYAVLGAVALQDLPRALQMVEATEGGRWPQEAINAISSSLRTDASRQTMLSFAESLPPEKRVRVYDGLLRGWITADPGPAVQWLQGLPEEMQKELRFDAGLRLIQVQPEAGAALMIAGGSARNLDNRYRQVVSAWPPGADSALEKWLAAQPQGPVLDSAYQSYAGRIQHLDPLKAISYAKTVHDEEDRKRAVAFVYQAWLQRDRPAAEAAMRIDGLTEEDVKARPR